MAKHRARLNLEQYVKLSNWLGSYWKEHEGRTDADVAEIASKVLGFPIAAPSVIKVCKAIGIERRKSRKARTVVGEPSLDHVSRRDFLLLAQEVRLLLKRQTSTPAPMLEALIEDYTTRH